MQCVRTEAPGSSDHLILRQAQNENRVVVTFDKDFGELAFHYGLPASAGIILFQITAHAPQHVARTAVASLATRQDWRNHFSVVEDRRIRMTPLPGTG